MCRRSSCTTAPTSRPSISASRGHEVIHSGGSPGISPTGALRPEFFSLTSYILRRIVQSIPLLLGVTLLSFVLLKSTPGGPLSIYKERADVSAEDLARLRQQLGLDDPLPVQYVKWLGNLARGDWGTSFVTNEQVTARIGRRLPARLYLVAVPFV